MLGSRFDYVKVRILDTEANPDSFPELNDERVAVSYLKDRPSFGICFSGGGTRSATATLGQLRALHKLGWLDKAQYISANSGGTWTSVPYTFLPDEYDDEVFLGDYLPPGAINDVTLKPDAEDKYAMATVIHHSKVWDKLLSGVMKGDEAYADIVGKIFLDPFKLHDRSRFFSFHDTALEDILNGNSELMQSDFYLARKNRPFLILVGTMLARQSTTTPEEKYLIEMTPLYVGVRRRFVFEDEDKKETKAFGGGYVEPFGYDSYPPSKNAESVNGRWEVRLKGKLSELGGDLPSNKRYRFTLSDAIGTSSAAPLVTLTQKGIRNFFFPEFRHWAVHDPNSARPSSEKHELQHGDGGDIDNLAIMPLLARQVENILVFINTRHSFNHRASCVSEEAMSDDLVSLFKETKKLKHNIVFDDGEAKLREICKGFREKLMPVDEAGEPVSSSPLVFCQTYQVIDNNRHGIRRYNPTICWVYLDRVQRWIDALPALKPEDEAKETLLYQLKMGEGNFDTFPHYATFGEKTAHTIDLDRERV